MVGKFCVFESRHGFFWSVRKGTRSKSNGTLDFDPSSTTTWWQSAESGVKIYVYPQLMGWEHEV